MTDRKSQDHELEKGAASPQPNQRRTPRLDRLNAMEQELLAPLARNGDSTPTPGSPAHTAAPPTDESGPVDQPAAPGADADVLGLLRALAGREAGPPQDDAATEAVAAEPPPEELFAPPAASSDGAAQPARRRPWRPGGRPLLLVAVFALSLAVVIGFTGMLWTWLSASGSVKTRQAKPETNIAVQQNIEPKPVATPAVPAAPVAAPAPAPQGPPDFLAAQQAMNDCDNAAANDLDSIFFLVIPIKVVQGTADTLAQRGDRFDKFTLLPSKATLDGLKDSSIALQTKRYTFAAIDAGSGKKQKFDPAEGLSRFVWHDNSTVFKFKVGFEAAGLGVTPKWSGEFPRARGACYWVNVLFQG